MITGLLAAVALGLGLWVAGRVNAEAPPPPPAPLVAAAPARAPAGDLGFIGVVVAGEAVDVEPRVEARIEEVLVKPGDLVQRGQLIARLDVETLRKELWSARVAWRDAERRLARRLRYARAGAFTHEELGGHRRAAAQGKAHMEQLARSVADGQLTAPFAGAGVERYLAAGALARPGRPVVRLARRGEPHVRFAIPEERAAAVKLGATVSVLVE